MDDFDTFKASREKIDPSARKFTQRQWQKAYSAYCSSRERVKEVTSTKTVDSSRRAKSPSRSGSAYGGGGRNHPSKLRAEVRNDSAYAEVRTTVDVLAWVAIGLTVLAAVIKLVYYTNPSAALVAILQAATFAVIVFALRLLAHAVIDIPDIALQAEASRHSRSGAEKDA